jgi:tetratricopeptide (TPR) repeat protein
MGLPSISGFDWVTMKKEEVLFGVIGLLAGLIGGYLLTNWYNDSVVGQSRSAATAVAGPTQSTLSPDEIKQLIQRADDAPENISFQKEVGISLYRYGANIEDSDLIVEVVRLLERVYSVNPKDRETLVTLGNAFFDIGFLKKENAAFSSARKFYLLALELQPDDADVRVDYGLTYVLQDPAEYEKAISEYEAALRSVPAHQRTLQMLTDALINIGRKEQASSTLEQLRSVNPSHPKIAEFEKKLSEI